MYNLSDFDMLRLLTFWAFFALAGCGTLYSSFSDNEIGTEKVRIHLDGGMDGVSVFVDDEPVVAKNGEIVLDKGRRAHFVTLKKDGYVPISQYFSREWNEPVVMLDVFLIVPLIVDAINKEIFRIEPTDIRVILRKED